MLVAEPGEANCACGALRAQNDTVNNMIPYCFLLRDMSTSSSVGATCKLLTMVLALIPLLKWALWVQAENMSMLLGHHSQQTQ